MSDPSNHVSRKTGFGVAGPPLAEGNRVLESIGRQESLRSLLAFSDLHEQIHKGHPNGGAIADFDLFQTERFVLDEVLQLVCNRAQALTHADAVIIALADGSLPTASGDGSLAEISKFVCRAAAGPLSIAPGFRLSPESQLLRECLGLGRILHCGDTANDSRAEFDLTRRVGALSTVLVPLRGRRDRLGLLQAFSTEPGAFTDQHIRNLDLFTELVLAALRPADQDRRFHWLSDVAGDILQAKPAAPLALRTATKEISQTDSAGIDCEARGTEELGSQTLRTGAIETEVAAARAGADASPALLSAAGANDLQLPHPPANLPTPKYSEPKVPEFALIASPRRSLSFAISSRPGLSVVLGLMAVAALFSAGVWWGMRVHAKDSGSKATASKTPGSRPEQSKVALASPANSSDPDNLMDPTPPAQPAALVALPEDELAALPKVTAVRHWSSSAGTTVVIDMQDQVPYEVHRLVSPARIYFDLHDTVLPHELAGKTMDVGDEALAKVRVGQPVAGVTRVVLDTADGSNFSVSMETNPYRLVVELRGTTKSAALNTPMSAAPKSAPLAALTGSTSVPPLPVKTGKFRIVLDAGHGGWDLGTVGRQGLLEKDLVLDVTQRLRKLLQTRLGSEVMLTRSDDQYLPLDQRADFANQAQADLFVSVHANYSSSATARGVETYYTNFFAAPGSKELEKHVDGTAAQVTPVSLSAGALHDKIEESRRLATSVQRSLYATLAAKSPDIRDRGIKDSAFAVLTGTTMPAILTEISFVSSPADEHNLQSENYRQQIAEALYKGIARYQESSPRAKVAQLQSGTTAR